MTIMTPSILSVKRGDVVLVLFPNSDLISAKARPALVVQSDNLATGIPQIILALITSRMSRAGHPSRITVLMNTAEGRATRLFKDSRLAVSSASCLWRRWTRLCVTRWTYHETQAGFTRDL